jgi:hypothetical protein
MSQNGKGSAPRNCFSQKFRDNYDYIFNKQMIYYLFLDDTRFPKNVTWVDLPPRNWTIVRSYKEFVDIINKNGIPQLVSYDHDLGDEAIGEAISKSYQSFDYTKIKEKTGFDCAKFLVEKCMDLNIKHPDFIAHSINPVGKENIEKYINNYNNILDARK